MEPLDGFRKSEVTRRKNKRQHQLSSNQMEAGQRAGLPSAVAELPPFSNAETITHGVYGCGHQNWLLLDKPTTVAVR